MGRLAALGRRVSAVGLEVGAGELRVRSWNIVIAEWVRGLHSRATTPSSPTMKSNEYWPVSRCSATNRVTHFSISGTSTGA